MPIYEYQCDSCDSTFEAIQKFSDAPLTACRKCGAEGIRKLLSAPAFRLKGGGWYETDFKSSNQRNIANSDSGGGASKSGSSSGDGGAKAAPAKSDSGASKGSSSGSSSGSSTSSSSTS
jgi:putative FmdB family regulatory protein